MSSRRIEKKFRALQAAPYVKEPKIEYPALGLGTDWHRDIDIFQAYEGVSEFSENLKALGSQDKIKNKKFDSSLLRRLKTQSQSISFIVANYKRYMTKEEQNRANEFIKHSKEYLSAAEKLEQRWRSGFRKHDESVPPWPLDKSFIQVCPKNVYGARLRSSSSSRHNPSDFCPTSKQALGHSKDVELASNLLNAAAINLQAARKIAFQRFVFFKNKHEYEKREDILRGAGRSPQTGDVRVIIPGKGPQKTPAKTLADLGFLDASLGKPSEPEPTPPSPEEKFDDLLMQLIESGSSPLEIIVRFVDHTQIEDSQEKRYKEYREQKIEFLESIHKSVSGNFQLLQDYKGFPAMIVRGSIDDSFVIAESPEVLMLEAYSTQQQGEIESGIDALEEPPTEDELEEKVEMKPKKNNGSNVALIAVVAVTALAFFGRK